jgi:hypothetical protein
MHVALVEPMLNLPGHAHYDRLLHLGTGNHANHRVAPPALFRGCIYGCCHQLFLSSCSRKSVLTRAKSFLANRKRPTASAWPVVS